MKHTNPEAIRRIADTWIRDAQRALDIGVRPAFYAFAPTDWRSGNHPLFSSVFFTQKVVAHLATHHRAASIDIFGRRGWIAVHTATYEQPVDFNSRRPDGTTWDMTLRGYEVVLRAFRDQFGTNLNVDEIPVMSTEGGVFTPESTSMNGHDRLSSNEEHAQRVVDMYRWLERHSPIQAMCPWCLSVGGKIGHFDERFRFDGYIQEINGQLVPRKVYEALRQLRFDLERRAERFVRLDVPYISQFDQSAATHSADCGPTCMAMILNAGRPADQHISVDALYTRHLPDKPVGKFTSISEMLHIGQDEGLAALRQDFADRQQALEGARSLVEQRKPFVALINYAKWAETTNIDFKSGHFVVVTGFDDDHVLVHDPLFRGQHRNRGEFFVWRNELFLDGWGSGSEIGNPNFAAIVCEKVVSPM